MRSDRRLCIDEITCRWPCPSRRGGSENARMPSRLVGCWVVARQRARAMSCAAVGAEHAESLVLATTILLPRHRSALVRFRAGEPAKPAWRWAPRRGAHLRNATKGVSESQSVVHMKALFLLRTPTVTQRSGLV
ncbi:hypothetical protein BDA96_04G288300 [Sorghum bicolor]|jgi:hypothetical protein|uniref:Uncharacterized protein n=2 Tax=Sorghum bicolor TaxID=4558 RepID=A0A921UK88_SORBI|nr:hypothetical protein BDA96_04G288300 [Sorghum bicolor]KXG30936.1 hypothetical protein SORBI_3004G270700 [Sorghum bicolor]